MASLSNAQKTGPATKPLKKIEESSDIYEDDDFESLSRSQQQMNQALPIQKKPLVSLAHANTISSGISQKTVIQTVAVQPVVKRDNQQTMTDTGKYNYSLDPTSGATTMKEMSLKRTLEDTEERVSELQVTVQRMRDENKDLELKMKAKDTEF